MSRGSVAYVRYLDGRGVRRSVLQKATERGFAIDDVSTEALGRRPSAAAGLDADGPPSMIEVTLHVHGKGSVNELAAALSDLDYMNAVLAGDASAIDE